MAQSLVEAFNCKIVREITKPTIEKKCLETLKNLEKQIEIKEGLKLIDKGFWRRLRRLKRTKKNGRTF